MIPFDTANPFSDGFDAGYGCLPLTRLAVYGTPGPQYGSFAGKVANVTVPDVTGLSQEDAETALIAEGLVLGTVTEANSETVATGLVISQDPAADDVVSPGSSVAIVVSLGALASDATGGWLTDPYGYETRRRAALKRERDEEDEARKQADEAIERAQEVAKAALQAKKSAKKPESPALNLAEASRLIDALEAAQSIDRRRRLAAVLLLMA